VSRHYEALDRVDAELGPIGDDAVERDGTRARPLSVQSEDRLPAPSDPMAVADRLVEQRYVRRDSHVLRHWRGGWWRWRTSHWAEVEHREVRRDAYRFTEKAHFLKPEKDGTFTERPWSPNRHKIADLLEAVQAVTHLSEAVQPPAWVNDADGPPPGEIVAVSNGLLHVRTRTLHPHDPRYFNQVAVPFDYQFDAPAPERWLAFLGQLWPDDPDSIAALQEFFGYVVSGRSDLHKIMLLVGPTRAGKGVIARIIRALVGRANVTGPTLASLGQNFGLQDLIGKPLAIVSDARLARADTTQVVERLLSVSGEDTLTIDRKYRDPWTGKLGTRFLLISNELPRFGDASGAIANRFVVLTMSTSWLGRENVSLTDDLMPELPGILNWSLDGLDRLSRSNRFTAPTSSEDAILALQDLVSPVAAFVRDRCAVNPVAAVPIDHLYAAWKVWADDNGHRPGSVQTFGRDLRAVIPGLRVVQPRGGEERERHYRGVALDCRPAIYGGVPGRADSVGGPDQAHISPDRVPPRANGANGGLARDGTRTFPLSAPVGPDELSRRFLALKREEAGR